MRSKNKGTANTALPPLPQRIVVGTDGTRESMGALRIAAVLQRESNARVEVVTAVEPPPTPMIPPLNSLPVREVEASRRRGAMSQMRRQVLGVRPTRRWTLSAVIGWPTEVILDLANDSLADLVIVGIGRHRLIDRLLAHETAITVARRTKVPMLAAAARARRRHVDLIAVGGHKQGFIDRMVIGSVTTRILRAAECSVLVVPKHAKR